MCKNRKYEVVSVSVEVKDKRQEEKNIKKLPARMPWVIPVNCEGCGGCVNYCRSGCLEMTETNVKGVFVPWLNDPHKCCGCGKCTDACVMGAISITSYVDRAAKRFIDQKPQIPTYA